MLLQVQLTLPQKIMKGDRPPWPLYICPCILCCHVHSKLALYTKATPTGLLVSQLLPACGWPGYYYYTLQLLN